MNVQKNRRSPVLAGLQLLVLLFVFSVQAQVLAQGKIDPGLAAALQKTLDAAAKTVPGVSCAIVIPGQGIWRGVSGISDIGEPIKQDMVFELGSLSKNYTAAFILKFVEKCGTDAPGAVCLDDLLTNYLPQYVGDVNAQNRATVRQVLNMTSGIYDFTQNSGYQDAMMADYSGFTTPQYVINTWLQAPNFAAGARYEYSNTNFVLAGILLQAQLHRFDLTESFNKALFDPLELKHTYIGGYEPVPLDEADGWAPFFGTNENLNMVNIPRRATLTSAWTAGGFIATADDIARWIDALYHRKVVVNQSALNEMLTFVDVSSPPNWWDGYGLGTMRMHALVGKEKTPTELYGYGGNTDVYTSYAFYLPARGCSIGFLINEYSANTQRVVLANALVNVLMEKLPAPTTTK